MPEIIENGEVLVIKIKERGPAGPPGSTVASGVTVTEVATLLGTDVQTALENLAARIAALEP